MGLQLSSLLVGDSRGTADVSRVSGVTEVPTGNSRTAGEAQTVTQAVTNKGQKEDKDALPDQCGLYDDGVAWKRKEASKRKRTSDATAEQQAKYRAILRTIFAVPSLLGQRVDFDPNDVVQISFHAMKYLGSEPALIEDIPAPITVVGDLHGQLYDLNRIFAYHEKHGKPGYESATKFIFLGNYVDRGRQSLEVVMALFILKILYPDNFFLLRGNHEFTETNLHHGFGAEILARFNVEAAKVVYAVVNTAFVWLSMAAIIGGKYFLVHAGISTTGFNKRGLRNLRKPIYEATASYLVHDMVWSDPADGLTGTCHNADRGTSIYFGEDVFAHAMHKINCLIMIRGHSRLSEGAACTWGRIYTIFSASACGFKNNRGAFAQLKADLSLDVFVFNVDKNRLAMDKALGFHEKFECQDEPEGKSEGRNDSLGSGTITAFN